MITLQTALYLVFQFCLPPDGPCCNCFLFVCDIKFDLNLFVALATSEILACKPVTKQQIYFIALHGLLFMKW